MVEPSLVCACSAFINLYEIICLYKLKNTGRTKKKRKNGGKKWGYHLKQNGLIPPPPQKTYGTVPYGTVRYVLRIYVRYGTDRDDSQNCD